MARSDRGETNHLRPISKAAFAIAAAAAAAAAAADGRSVPMTPCGLPVSFCAYAPLGSAPARPASRVTHLQAVVEAREPVDDALDLLPGRSRVSEEAGRVRRTGRLLLDHVPATTKTTTVASTATATATATDIPRKAHIYIHVGTENRFDQVHGGSSCVEVPSLIR